MMINATIVETNDMITDSVRNCAISIPLVEPPSFFIPTSLALADACAVERFVKFTTATSSISKAIVPKILNNLGSPGARKEGLIEVSR